MKACLPSTEHLVFLERQRIFDRYARRQESLLAWNAQLRRAGLVDEIRATRFDLSARVALSKREPEPPVEYTGPLLTQLPEIAPGAPLLEDAPPVVRGRIARHHPRVGVHRARTRRFAALSDHESAARLPSPRFVDFGFEPEPYSGDERQYGARIAFEIPFGFEARARSRRYAALAHAEVNRERAMLRDRAAGVVAAVGRINEFRSRGGHWRALEERAEAAEATADRWFENRSARPSQVSGLLEDVFEARTTLLDARARAGRAGCVLLEASGAPVASWPLEIP